MSAIALLAFFGFGAATVWARGAKPLGVDLRVTTSFQTLRNPFFARLMFLVSSLGSVPVVHLLLFAGSGFLWLRGRKLESLFTLASAGAAAMVVLVKIVVGRPRPSGEGVRVALKMPDYGFPSGHTAHYISFYGFLAYLAATQVKAGVLRTLFIGLASSSIALVGPSRIYLGQHWLSDVLAAYLLGFAYLVGLVKLYRRVRAMTSRS